MTTRRPLVQIDGKLYELPLGDSVAGGATDLNTLPLYSTGTPQAAVIKVGGIWVQIPWALFLSMTGSAPLDESTKVTVKGANVRVDLEQVTVNADAPVKVDGEEITVNGEPLLATV